MYLKRHIFVMYYLNTSLISLELWLSTRERAKIRITRFSTSIISTSRKHTFIILTPLKTHFYIVKFGFTGYTLFFLLLLKNIDCGYLQSMFWAEIWKISGFKVDQASLSCNQVSLKVLYWDLSYSYYSSMTYLFSWIIVQPTYWLMIPLFILMVKLLKKLKPNSNVTPLKHMLGVKAINCL